MKITCNHPASLEGLPVILDDVGQTMSYPDGLTEALYRLRMSRATLARSTGYRSAKSINRFFQSGGNVPSAHLLNFVAMRLTASERPEKIQK